MIKLRTIQPVYSLTLLIALGLGAELSLGAQIPSARKAPARKAVLSSSVEPDEHQSLLQTDRARAEELMNEAEELTYRFSFTSAMEKLETAFKLTELLSEPKLTVRCLNLMGNVSDSQGNYGKGSEQHQRALDLAEQMGDQKLTGSILADIGLGHWKQSNYAQALDYCLQALSIQKQIDERLGQSKTLVYLGRIHFKQGEYDAAVASLSNALELQQAADDRKAQSVTFEDLGDVYQEQGAYAQALQHYQHSLQLREQIEDGEGQCYMLHIIGRCYMVQGAYSEALAWYRRSLKLAQKYNDRSGYAEVFYHMGIAYSRQGAYERALACYQRALLTMAELGNPRQQAWVLAFTGDVHHRRGEFTQALAFYERAMHIWQEMGDRRGLERALSRLGQLYYDAGDNQRSLEYYERDAQLQEETQMPYLSRALGGIGKIHSRRGDDIQALHYGRRAVEMARQTDNLEVQWSAFYTLGSIERQSGLRQEALQSFQESVAVIERLRANVTAADETKVGFLEGKQTVYADTISLLLELGRNGEALELAERARARAFLDLLGGRELQAKPADVRALAHIRQLQRQLDRKAPINAALGSPEIKNSMRGNDLIKLELSKLQHEQPELASLVSVQPSALPQLQEAARRRQSTIVEYFSSDDRLFIWVIEPQGTVHATSSAIARRELDQLVQQMRRSELTDTAVRNWDNEEIESGVSVFEPRVLSRGDLNEKRARKPRTATEDLSPLRRLHQVLVEPIAMWLPKDPDQLVTIIPHGPLFLISFAALPDHFGRYLVERHTINYCPSISLLHYTGAKEKRALQIPARHLLVVGNPSMPRFSGRRQSLPSLPGAENEVRAISKLYPPIQVTTLVGTRAEERLVRELAPGQAVIHLATHGVIRDDEPLESFLVLAPRKGLRSGTATGKLTATSDGPLTVREVFQLDLNANLVVLSACNTGLGKINGDGVIGLSRAFVYAGTPSVIVSLWRVADIVARFEMEQFYSELKRNGGNKAAALRHAQVATLTMLRRNRLRTPSGKPLGEHPLFWAPFVLIGEAL